MCECMGEYIGGCMGVCVRTSVYGECVWWECVRGVCMGSVYGESVYGEDVKGNNVFQLKTRRISATRLFESIYYLLFELFLLLGREVSSNAKHAKT